MSNIANPNTCPKCDAPIPADAPQGLCPKCVLLGAATATEAGLSPTDTAEIPSLERVAAAFPQLEIIELLGRGGMGFVFKACQPNLDRFVALKLLPDKLARDPHFAERFSREGRVLARLSHPGIVSIYDFGQAGGFYYLLMEYVDGVNLRQAMQAGKFSPAAALAVVPKICEALQYAHEQGVLHRDIKPANILLDSKGRVKIADFGIAKLVGEEKADLNLTATGATIGTPQYMAPEQLEKPASVDHRADIYSLGVVFYEMLTGELPIGRFAPPSQRTPLDPRVDEVVMRTLEKEREKRYQSAGDVKTNVEHLTEAGAGGEAGVSQPVTPDFILCHPRLPRMAQLLTVYALVVSPALWFIDLATMGDTTHPNAYAAFVEAVMRLVTFWGELIVTILLFIGGWKLRALQKAGTRFIRAGIWLNLGCVAVAMTGVIAINLLAPETNPSRFGVGEAVLTVTQLAAWVFQIVVLVWLRRHGAALDNIFRAAAGRTGPRGTIAIPPGAVLRTQIPGPGAWSKLALAGAGLVGVSLPIPVILLGAMIVQAGGIGGSELVLMLASGGLFGVAGTLLGWMGLSNIRASGGTTRGLPPAVFAALAWPLLVLLVATVGLPSLALVQPSDAGAWGTLWHFLLLLVPVCTLTFSLWAIYAAARWGANQPTSRPRGILKWIFLVLLLWGGALAVLARMQGGPQRLPNSVRNLEPLPEGLVELVAISREPADGVWWRPDGTPANEGAFEIHGSSPEIQPGERAVLFIFRSRDSERSDSSYTYDFPGAKTWFAGRPPRLNGRTVSGGSFVTATFPESLNETTVRVGIAIDAWETVATDSTLASLSFGISRHGQAQSVAFFGATEDKSGATILTLTHQLNGEDVRILAVDRQGGEHASTTQFAVGDRHKFTIPNLSPTRVQEYRLQVRPYRWADFKNVQLSPASSGSVRAPLSGSSAPTNAANWIGFTFTAVELREVEDKRWLAIDYLDEVHGDCQKSFPWETKIPGFRVKVRTSEFVKDPIASPEVRHQRVEYLLPDSVPQEAVENLRATVEQALKHKTIRLEPGQEQLLFAFGSSSDTALKGWIKVTPPLKLPP